LIERLFSAETDASLQESVSEQILQHFAEAQVVEKTQALVERFINEACEAVQFLPDNTYRQALLDLTAYVTQREH
jgi:geranylgeranyl pyrophosphate synthase